MSELFFFPVTPAINLNGFVAAGATLSFYISSTTTPAIVYADSGLTSSLGSVVTANGAGRFPAIYLDDAVIYRVRCEDSSGAELFDIDSYNPGTIFEISDELLEARDEAVTSAASAAVSRDIALSSSEPIYDTIAAGLSASSEGDIFRVAASGTGFVGVYRKVSGAEVLVFKQPTSGSLPGLGQWQRFISKLDNANEDASVVLLGDSTGDATGEWFYLYAQSIASLYPAWTVEHYSVSGSAYGSATVIQTGTGARTVKFYNGSIAGMTPHRFAGVDFTAFAVTPNPDLVFLSFGHNGSTTAQRQFSFWHGLCEKLSRQLPYIPVIAIGQNPITADETMAAKIGLLRPLAANYGWGYINVHDAFKQAGVALSTLLQGDGVHPNATGSALWRDVVLGTMQGSRGAQGAGTVVTPQLLRSWRRYNEWLEWSFVNCTSSQETTIGDFEASGESIGLTQTSTAAIAYANLAVIGSDDITAFRGTPITFYVKQKVTSGQQGIVGRIDLVMGGQTFTSTGVQQEDGFITYTCTAVVPDAATNCIVYLYCGAASAPSAGVLKINRASLSWGVLPYDTVIPDYLSARRLFLMGTSSSGLSVFHNTSSSEIGNRFIPTVTTNSTTGWTSDHNQNGFAVKQTGDAHPRAFLRQDGLYVGDGTAAASIRFRYRLAGSASVSAHWVADANATYDLGGSGVAWRDLVLTRQIFINGVKVLGTQGAAVTDATGGATVDTEARAAINSLLARLRSHGIIAT